MQLGLLLVIRHFRCLIQDYFILIKFYITLPFKVSMTISLKSYVMKFHLFSWFKTYGYICPNLDYKTINNIVWRDFLSFRFFSRWTFNKNVSHETYLKVCPHLDLPSHNGRKKHWTSFYKIYRKFFEISL